MSPSDPLANFRGKNATVPKEKEAKGMVYQAFKQSENPQRRVMIWGPMVSSKIVPSYFGMEMKTDGFGQYILLRWSLNLAVSILGRNLENLAEGLRQECVEIIRLYEPPYYEEPTDPNAPVITEIIITEAPLGPQPPLH